MEITIRELQTDEQAPYALLLLADPSLKLVNEYLPRGICFLAMYQKEIAGVLVLVPTRPETREIVNIAVKEEFQRKGIGKQLIHFAIHKAREMHTKTLEIGTGNPGVGQLLLYQKCGFRITGVDQDFFVRHYKEEIYENGIQCRDMIRLSMDI